MIRRSGALALLAFVLAVVPQTAAAKSIKVNVHRGDHVLVAYNAFGKPLLKLAGPQHAHTGKAFSVKVVNGRDGTPVQGAKLRGHKTNANGKVKLVVNKTGTVRLKARKPGTIRSNELDVAVGP